MLRKELRPKSSSGLSAKFLYLMLLLPIGIAMFYYLVVGKKAKPNCDSFDVYKGNIVDSTRIILGEFHSKNQNTLKCLDFLTSSQPHVVLLESVPENKVVKCSDHAVEEKEGRVCKGWNDEQQLLKSLRHQINAHISDIIYGDLVDFYQKENWSMTQLKGHCQAELKKIQKELQHLEKIMPAVKKFGNKFNIKEYNDVSSYKHALEKYDSSNNVKYYFIAKAKEQLLQRIQSIITQSSNFPTVINTIAEENKNQMNDAQQYITNLPRQMFSANQAMLRTVRKQTMPTYVITGKEHIAPRDRSNYAAAQLVEGLEKDKKKNPYVALVMK